ncbi:MAG TPA: energy transducer TonB [Opitutaceae bacterium]|jgi:TonB family protein
MLAGAVVALSGCAGQEYVSEHPISQEPPPLKPGVVALKNVDVRPVPIHEVEPADPPELGSILTGNALVVFTVGATGKVTDAAVVQADDVLFGEAALAAIVKWKFRPAQIKSEPVACRMTLPFEFNSPYGYYIDDSNDPPGVPGSPPDSAPSKTLSNTTKAAP